MGTCSSKIFFHDFPATRPFTKLDGWRLGDSDLLFMISGFFQNIWQIFRQVFIQVLKFHQKRMNKKSPQSFTTNRFPRQAKLQSPQSAIPQNQGPQANYYEYKPPTICPKKFPTSLLLWAGACQGFGQHGSKQQVMYLKSFFLPRKVLGNIRIMEQHSSCSSIFPKFPSNVLQSQNDSQK